MQINGDKVVFDECDKHFVDKFGADTAAEMVLDFTATSRQPFIYDTYQLASLLRTGRKELFDITRNSDRCYQEISIPKKNGGVRKINAPEERLKRIQRIILEKILSKMPVSKYATAYHEGATLKDNALPHCGKKYILKMDLEDFYGSIQFYQVYNAAFNTQYFPRQIGTMLTTLCCRDDELPQGAPTSPALSNLVLRHFDNIMGEWCAKKNISYTRYCDDITFSGDSSLYVAYVKAKSMLENMGFTINEKKTHFVTNVNRQTVTGLTVNEKVSVSSDYKRKLRQEIYYAVKYGLEDAILFSKKYDYMDDGFADVGSYYMHLVGQINFVLDIEPENRYFIKALQDLKNCRNK